MKLLIFFAIACSIPALEAIKCYVCDTMTNPDTCKNYDDKHLVECPEGLKSCIVSRGTDNADKSVIIRMCAPEGDDKCIEEPSGKATSCICNKDKCNNSNVVTSSIVSLLALFLVIVYNCFYS